MIKVIFITLLILLFLTGLVYLFNKKNEGYDQSWNFVDHVVCITFNKDKKYQDELRKRLSFIKPQSQIIIFKGFFI